MAGFDVLCGPGAQQVSADESQFEKNLEGELSIKATLLYPDWAAATVYAAGRVVVRNSSVFLCKTTHTSNALFHVDWLTNGHWIPIGDAPGDFRETAGAATLAGFVPADNKTVGKTGSGADYEGDLYRDLYERIQANFGGSYDWAAGGKVNLPDRRGIYAVGAGTTNRAAGKSADGNFYAGGITGAYVTDQTLAHEHASSDAADGYAVLAAGGSSEIAAGGSKNLTLLSNLDTGPAKAAGYGAPREGAVTRPASVTVTVLIKI